MLKKNSITIYDFMNVRERYRGYAGFAFESISTLVHQHSDFYEIILITSGEWQHTFENTTNTCLAGTLLLFAPGSVHQLFTEPFKSAHFVICVEAQYFKKRIGEMFPDFDLGEISGCISKSVSKDKLKYMERLGNALCKDVKSNYYMAEEFLFLCIADFMSRNVSQDCDFYIADIIQKLNNQLYMNLSAKDIYSKYPYSASVLLQKFKEITGMTIAEYRTEQKMKYACQLLTETDIRVIEIAVALNYTALSYFLRAFKQKFGMTPTEYRKKYSNL